MVLVPEAPRLRILRAGMELGQSHCEKEDR